MCSVDAAPAALVPVPIPSTVPRPRALGQHGRGHLLVARQPSLALPPPLAALPPTIAPRLVAPIPPLAPTATRYGGLALRDIAFGSSQGRLGKGGQGIVRVGRHYGGRLAVKQPLRASSAFASECQIAAALHHENIIHVMGFACAPRETPFLALDYADAGTLGDLLIGDQRGESRSLGVQIARAMSYLAGERRRAARAVRAQDPRRAPPRRRHRLVRWHRAALRRGLLVASA